ncbi:MAG: DUF6377 domain-containing protein [Bacteroidales bacterium]|nr:DUF6377 domain-containing protein [Bacteroidales bacterium]
MRSLLRHLTIFIAVAVPLHSLAISVDLRRLDRALDHADTFTSRRMAEIDSIKSADGIMTPYDRDIQLARRYADFDIDSAVVYATRAREKADTDRRMLSADLLRASIYNSSLMMYKEAADIFADARPDRSDTAAMLQYYTLGVQLYRNLEEMAPDAGLTARYASAKRTMRDSVLSITSDAPIIHANSLIDQGRLADALDVLLPLTREGEFSPANGAVYHVIANIYGLQGNTGRQIDFLALAAQADIENGVREYVALPQLALLLYEQGDIDRAYRYMRRSIDDATACNARIRMLGMSSTMSVISTAYGAAQRAANTRMVISLIIMCILLVVTVVCLIYSRRRNHLLQQARRRQEEANTALKAASRVKEKYVNRFMHLSLDYLNKMERYRKDLFKIASRRNFDALYDAINSTGYIDAESDEFYRNFDEAFLELYPGFVDWFNSLLQPGLQVKLRDGDRLNTELRIFALMRLGITESADISRFLRCSQSTVYNYRTRYRNRAVDRNRFIEIFYLSDTKAPN